MILENIMMLINDLFILVLIISILYFSVKRRMIVMGRKYKNMNDKEIENYESVTYRVMFRDSNNKINERKFKSEEGAKEFYYSIDDKNRTKQLDLIKNCRFTSLLFERLGGYNK